MAVVFLFPSRICPFSSILEVVIEIAHHGAFSGAETVPRCDFLGGDVQMNQRDLIAEWRLRSDEHSTYGNDGAATAFRIAADELESAIQAEAEELLRSADASRVSGYSADQLRRLSKAGKLTNYGRKGAPRYRRAELPYKLSTLREPVGRHQLGSADMLQIARSIVHRN
jgi:hypothetical protein